VAEPTEEDHVSRIVERLRKDHPNPEMRAQLYDEGKLDDYVRTLLNDAADDELVERVTASVRAAEDGTSAE
jgi:hypothetical protein